MFWQGFYFILIFGNLYFLDTKNLNQVRDMRINKYQIAYPEIDTQYI